MFKSILLLTASITQAVLAGSPDVTPSHIDASTYANIDEVVAQHMSLDFKVDFEKKQFIGANTIDLKVIKSTDHVILDFVGIDIGKVFIDKDGKQTEAKFDVRTDLNKNLGNALYIYLPEAQNVGDEFKAKVVYETNQDSMAINWLTPSQTAGKKLPYLFTQCESIACRSVAPMQDTPAVKITYDASVLVDQQFVVKMSANETYIEHRPETNETLYRFENQIKMPSYLIAIAVGDLEYRSLGRRVGVITEPSQMDFVANELVDLEMLLDKTEEYLTSYIWGNYSILILPPSFPFGGMENPLLTFASPTIITGDKSQVYVATHEIAHSWTGNDVTCKDWENFWLNEGFTVFEERKISGKLHGEEFAKVEALLGNSSMYTDMLNYGLKNPFSSLHPTLKGHSPDDAFSTIPYDKGFQLLHYLESLVGEDNFQTFLRKYITDHAQTSVITNDLQFTWEVFVEDHYNATETNRILASVDWASWIFAPGLPPVYQDFTTKASNDSAALADDYIKLAGKSSPDNYTKFNDYYSNLKVIFLERLAVQKDNLTLDILKKVDADYNLTATVDPECKQRWFPIGIRAGYAPVLEQAHTFVSVQGRMKYLNPIYRALLDTDQKDLAVKWFNENIDFYHPLAIASLKKLLGLEAKQTYLGQLADTIAEFVTTDM